MQMIIFRGGYSRSINYNALLENATYKREGYRFTGWTGSNGDTPQLNVTIPKGSIGDLTFNANWELDGIAGPVLSGYIREDNGKPRLTWTAVSDTIQYEMFRSEDNGITWQQVYKTEDLSYTNIGAKAGITYKYKIRAIIGDTEEESLFSNIVTLTPIMVTPVLNGELNEDYNPHLYWDDYYVDYYEVYRSTDQKIWTKMWDTKETQGKSYTNTDVTKGTTVLLQDQSLSRKRRERMEQHSQFESAFFGILCGGIWRQYTCNG